MVLTDNREQLIETLEANTGERITALDAIGEVAVREVPAKAEVGADEAAAFVERLRAEREHDAAITAAHETAHRVGAWLVDAERTLAPRPAAEPERPHATTPRFADGYEHEEWRHALEALVTEGRTAVREAVESGAVDAHAAPRVRDTMARLERVLADEQARAAERVAVARAQAWFLDWVDAEDPEDPFRPCSPVATVEEGRRIAADPALTDDWRRNVIDIVDGHDAREAAVNAAEPWLRAWERFERGFADRAAAFDSPEAPVRIARGRALRYSPKLPTPLERSIAAIVDAYGAHYAGREREESPRRIEAEFDRREAQDSRQATLDAARTRARRAAAEALRESDATRRALDRDSRDGSGFQQSVDRCRALAANARGLAPNLPRTEASNLAEAVREAGRRLRRRLFGAVRLDRIRRVIVVRWFDAYSGTAPGGANRVLDVLRQILNHALVCGHIATNPARNIRRNRGAKLTRFLSREEIHRLHRALDNHAHRSESARQQVDIIRLLLLTGCRKNEIVRLRWQEADGDRLNLTDTKTGPRRVFLNAQARTIIDRRKKRADSPWVFPSVKFPTCPQGDGIRLWYTVRREAGIEDVRLHDLRHTVATHAVMQGVPLPIVARLLGHRHPSMTLRYAHVGDSEIEAAAERVGQTIARLMAA